MARVSTAELREREVWTCGEAARVLGRGADFWMRAFDVGAVQGYLGDETGRGRTRYVFAASCRGHLERLAAERAASLRVWDPEAQRKRVFG